MRLPLILLSLFVALSSGCLAQDEATRTSAPVATHVANAWPAPATTLPRQQDALALRDRTPLTGAGAVAFHPVRQQLAWADGQTVHVLDLGSGRRSAIRAGTVVSDLGFAPGGELWVIAGPATLWRDGVQVCRSGETALDRVLGIDHAGMVAAGYSHADGIGPLRHQVAVDNACRVERESTEPLPAGMHDTDADRGGKPWRDTLRSPRALPAQLPWTFDEARVSVDAQAALALPSPPVAVSADGRWWVFDEAGERALWRLAEPE